MDVTELRARQTPLKERYRSDPETARTPLSATADWREPGITSTVETWAGPARAGRSHDGKLLIAGAVEIKGKGPGRAGSGSR